MRGNDPADEGKGSSPGLRVGQGHASARHGSAGITNHHLEGHEHVIVGIGDGLARDQGFRDGHGGRPHGRGGRRDRSGLGVEKRTAAIARTVGARGIGGREGYRLARHRVIDALAPTAITGGGVDHRGGLPSTAGEIGRVPVGGGRGGRIS